MIWDAMSSAGVGPLCFLKTNVTAPIYQEIVEYFMLPSADQLFKDADFIFQQNLAPAHSAKSTKSWLIDHGICVLDCTANSPDLNPIENRIEAVIKAKGTPNLSWITEEKKKLFHNILIYWDAPVLSSKLPVFVLPVAD